MSFAAVLPEASYRPRTVLARLLSAVAVAVLAACSSDPAAPACAVSAVSVTPASPSITVGGTSQLAATVSATNCATTPSATWSSSAEGVATVSGTGLVTAVAPGTATISATAGGRTGQATVTVTPVPVATVTVFFSANPRLIGESATATVTVRDSAGTVLTGRLVRWSSANAAIATVDSTTGVVTAVAPGSVAIRATVEGVVGSANLLVLPAAESARFAFAWASNATATIDAPYVPSPNWAHNATGGGITVTRTAVGRYTVRFERLGKLGFMDGKRETVLASAYGTEGRYCSVLQFLDGGGADLSVEVACHALDGTDADTRFTIAVIGSNTLAGNYAFGWNDTPAGGLNDLYSFSSAAGSSVSVRTALGRYTVDFPIGGLVRSTVITTAASAQRFCHPTSWGAGNGTIATRCVNASGSTDADARFTALMTSGGRPGKRWGFVWNDQPSTAIGTPYSPHPSYREQSNGEETTIRRLDIGLYEVRLAGLGVATNRETVLISSYGGGSLGPCQIVGWSVSGSDLVVSVSCWAFATGARVNSSFSLLVLE